MSNRQSLLQAIKCFGDPTLRQNYFEIYSADIVLHGYRGVEPGLESVKKFYNSFWEVFPDARIEIQELVEQEEALAVRYTITGTHHKDFMGIVATGRKIEISGSVCCTLEMDYALNDGRVQIPSCYWLNFEVDGVDAFFHLKSCMEDINQTPPGTNIVRTPRL